MKTMFASVSAGAAVAAVSAAGVVAGGVMLDAAAVESARMLSRAASFLAQAATVTSMNSATVRVLGIATLSEEGEQKNRRYSLTFCKWRSNRPPTVGHFIAPSQSSTPFPLQNRHM